MVFAVSHHRLNFYYYITRVSRPCLLYLCVSVCVCEGRGRDTITRGSDSNAKHFIIGICARPYLLLYVFQLVSFYRITMALLSSLFTPLFHPTPPPLPSLLYYIMHSTISSSFV